MTVKLDEFFIHHNHTIYILYHITRFFSIGYINFLLKNY